MTITEFLAARLAEDEAQARYVHEYGSSAPSALFAPARVLAECAAKRDLIRLAAQAWTLDDLQANQDIGYDDIENTMLRTLAAVYKDHPDYQQEWAA